MPADCAAVCADAATACVAQAVAAAEAEAALQRVPPEALEQQLLGSRLRVGRSHFAAALDAAVPASLRGVMLPEVPRVAWADVGGYEDVKRALREMIEVRSRLWRPTVVNAWSHLVVVSLSSPAGLTHPTGLRMCDDASCYVLSFSGAVSEHLPLELCRCRCRVRRW